MKNLTIPLMCIMSFTALPTVAQSDSNEGAMAIEEIIVTARMREESMQTVPLAITPFTTSAIERRDMVDLEDFASATIGMSYLGASTSGYQSTPTIRGLSSGFLQDRVQNVAVFLNGIYLQRQSMMNVGMLDMERVEIVRGPQNSLYGHSAFAGAINYITEKPGHEFGGYLHTTQGDDEREDYRLSVEGPLYKDILFARLTAGTTEYDGHTENDHPYADADPSGYNNRGNLGGWDDNTLNLALAFQPSDNLSMDLGYYKTRLKRENQPSFVLGGLREVAVTQISRYDDMNFNEVSYNNADTGQITTGNTMWQGALPFKPDTGTCINGIPFLYPCPTADTRSTNGVVMDPRSYGFVADTEVLSFAIDWRINDSVELHYLFGDVGHSGSTAGVAERDPLQGSVLQDPNFLAVPFPQFNEVYSNISSARPITDLNTQSHELRLDFDNSDRLQLSIGAYYSEVEDEQYDETFFSPVCSDRDLDGSGSNSNEAAACDLAFNQATSATPLDDIQYNPFWIFAREKWNGQKGNWTKFEDKTLALFANVDLQLTERLNLRLEGRYSRDEREVQRLTDGFGLKPGESGIIFGGSFPFPYSSTIQREKDSDTFTSFAPKVGLDFQLNDDHFLYAYVAKGIKSGGFNNASDESQQTYDDEENITYELGTHSMFFDQKLRLNASVYYIDWSDIQGSEPPANADSINAASVIGNIGDATSTGIEVEMNWYATDRLSFDLGFALNKAEYDSGTQYDPAQRHYYYQCDRVVESDGGASGTANLCGNTEVGGNSLPRNPETQVVAAINYHLPFASGWSADFRLDGNYQSKQYISPLNVAHIEDRVLTNMNIMVQSPEHWELSFWVKNLLDEEYVGGALLIAEQNKLIVSTGAPRTMGMGIRYLF